MNQDSTNNFEFITTKRDLATIKIKNLKYVGTLQIKIEYTST